MPDQNGPPHEKPRVLARARINARAPPRRPSTFLKRLEDPSERRKSESSQTVNIGEVERALLDRISISSSSSSDSEESPVCETFSGVLVDEPTVTDATPRQLAPSVASTERQDDSGKENELDESVLVVSSALEEKARKILERELMFEKLIAQNKATLEDLEEQINELGKGYITVRRGTGSGPPRKRIDIPDLPPSPIKNVYDKSGNDEADKNFSKVLQCTPPKPGRPPLAPAPFRPPLLASRSRNN